MKGSRNPLKHTGNGLALDRRDPGGKVRGMNPGRVLWGTTLLIGAAIRAYPGITTPVKGYFGFAAIFLLQGIDVLRNKRGKS